MPGDISMDEIKGKIRRAQSEVNSRYTYSPVILWINWRKKTQHGEKRKINNNSEREIE